MFGPKSIAAKAASHLAERHMGEYWKPPATLLRGTTLWVLTHPLELSVKGQPREDELASTEIWNAKAGEQDWMDAKPSRR